MRKSILSVFVILFGISNVPAQSGKYLMLDGASSYMRVPNNSTVNVPASNSFTLTCWVNLSNSSTSRRIISKRLGATNYGYEFITSGSMQYGVNVSDATGGVGPAFSTATIGGSWHHLAMVIDRAANTCSIYIDGVLDKSNTNARIATGDFTNTQDLLIGAWNNNGALASYAIGKMDDIRLWSTAFTQSQVQNDMTASVTGPTTNLLAAWDFENASGTSVPDISGNGNTGTLNGNATIAETQNMLYSGASLTQTVLPTGIGNSNQKILAVNVNMSGTLNPVNLTSLVFNMNGTTNISDVKNIHLYFNGNNNILDTATATKLGTASPATGDISFSVNQTLSDGSNYFFITYDVSNTATEGHILDAEAKSVTVGGIAETISPSATAGSRMIALTNTLLFKPGDGGSASYRIPAIVTAADGSLVTAIDKRNNGAGDLGKNANIDIVVKRSTDNGKTWSAPLTIAGEGTAYCYGDPSLVVDKTSGDIICLYNANTGFFQSSQSDWVHICMSRSTDNGVTWSAPTDITDQIYGPNCTNPISKNWLGVFVTSGRLTQLRSGRILGVMPVREPSGNTGNFVIYSDDGGTTWATAANSDAVPSSGGNGNESKTVQLDNDSVLMSIRTPYTRRYNLSGDGGITWGTAYNSTLTEPGCNGDIMRYTSVKDGFNKSRLLHSLPNNQSSRQNVSLYLSYDEGKTWPFIKTIDLGSSAYSSITVLDDGTIGIYYEDGEDGQVFNMYFTRVSLDWLSDGSDTYLPAGVLAQTDSISLMQAPQNLQFYARDANDSGTVIAKGLARTPGFTSVKADYYKDNTLFATVTQPLQYNGDAAFFDVSRNIKAEFHEYKVIVTATRNNGSSLVLCSADSLLCGDVFAIAGQSNSHPTRGGYTFTDQFLRSFGKQTPNGNYDTYQTSDTTWGKAQANYTGTPGSVDANNPTFFAGDYMVGVWGLQMMDSLKNRLQIPICVINGGAGSSTIEQNLPTSNHYDLTTIYGRMMYRLEKSGLRTKVKALFWHQGEKNEDGSFSNYPANFNTMHTAWKQDMPGLQRIYVFQTNLNNCYGAASINQSAMRDFQRKLPQTYSDIITIATAGVPGSGNGASDANDLIGCHYGTSGYEVMGTQAFYVLSQDLYNVDFGSNVLSPNIVRAYYTDDSYTQLNLVFDNEDLVTPQPYNGNLLKDYFYFNGTYGHVDNLTVVKDTVKITFTGTQQATRVTYLPDVNYNGTSSEYYGPYLTNEKGIGALTFYNFPIENGPAFHRVTPAHSLVLDGINSYMSVADAAELNVSTQHGFTISAWVKVDPSQTDYQRIFSKRYGSTNGYELFVGSQSNNFGKLGVNLSTPSSGGAFGNTTVNDNTWHHVAVVVNPSANTVTQYIDGTVTGSNMTANINSSSSNFSNTQALLFGAWNNNGTFTNFMKGEMDDIHIWSSALSQDSIFVDMSLDITGSNTFKSILSTTAPANMVAAYDFENVAAGTTTIPDVTGNNHPGTLMGNAALPVVISSFSGDYSSASNSISLQWKTANVVNIQKVVLEYSVNGNSYQPLYTTMPEGSETVSYSFTHPLNNITGTHVYYRLKIVDKDGNSIYNNKILSFEIGHSGNAGISLYPNPATETLHVSTGLKAPLTVSIYSISGTLVTKKNEPGNNFYINISSLPSGVYVLKVSNNEQQEQAKFIKR